MESKPFSEELIAGNPKKINLYLLIFTILIAIILIIIIIVLSVKLNNKSKDNEDIKKQLNSLEDKYKRQNNTLNEIFHVFQTLISKTNITHNNINKDDYSNVISKVEIQNKKFRRRYI